MTAWLLLPKPAQLIAVVVDVVWVDGLANWRNQLTRPRGGPKLMQYCHGAPGYVICLADFPGPVLDAILLAAGGAIWQAGPLRKGSNLCHGTGGKGGLNFAR